MKLREWAQRCSVGDTCVVGGHTVECIQPDPYSPGAPCTDCVFNTCEIPLGGGWDCCDHWWCDRISPDESVKVCFRMKDGCVRHLNPLAEIESCTLHPYSNSPNERAGHIKNKVSAMMCADFVARLSIIKAGLDVVSMHSLVCAGMPDNDLTRAEQDLRFARKRIASLIELVDAFRFNDERNKK